MPSLAAPFTLAPYPAMTRPRTGQRKLGTEPVSSAVAEAARGSGLSVAGVASRAVAGGWPDAAEAAGLVWGGGAGANCAAGAGAGAWLASLMSAWRTPGVVRRWPARTAAEGSISLASASTWRDLP